MATADLAPPSQLIKTAQPAPARGFLHSLTFWTIAALAIGVAWRIARFLLQFPIWGDESFVCVNFLDNTFSGILGPLRVGQICPLTFLWSELAVYQWLGASELAMRLLPLLAGLGALALFWPLCRRVLPPVPASLALALLAVSYYPVRHAVEVKPYSEDLFVALGLLVPAAWYILEPERQRWLVLLTLFVPAALVSSYPAVLVAGAVSVVLLPIVRRRPERSSKAWFLLYNALLVGVFLGNYFLIGKPQLSPNEGDPSNAFNSTWQDWFPSAAPGDFLLWFLRAHTGNMLAYPIGGPDFASSFTTLLCLAGAWQWWRHGNRQILTLLAMPFLLSMAAAVLHKYPYGGSARLDQHLAPAICLLMGNGIALLIHRFAHAPADRHQGALVALVLLTAFGTVGLVRDIVKPFKTTAEVWNRTFVQELMQRLGPDDRVVIFHPPAGLRPGLEWYFRQHDDRVRWHGALDSDVKSSAKTWCVQFGERPERTVPAIIAGSGRALVQVDHYQGVAPPEHGDDPEIADVYCFVAR